MLELTTLVIATTTGQEPEWDYEDAKQPENNDIPHKNKHHTPMMRQMAIGASTNHLSAGLLVLVIFQMR